MYYEDMCRNTYDREDMSLIKGSFFTESVLITQLSVLNSFSYCQRPQPFTDVLRVDLSIDQQTTYPSDSHVLSSLKTRTRNHPLLLPVPK